ncbi:MAG: septal ring lytic transglycosylase RlpA family protein [Bryobacteraceae bacterium]|jgi:rare lipoprotein A
MPPHRYSIPALAALAAALAAVAQAQPPAPAEEGIASWYGGPFEGQRSASGEIYHQAELTAAHRTLAFGTKVRVRRLDSGQSVVVRINDRGPYVASRIIDLSYAAAHGLGMTHPGLVPVAVEILDSPVSSGSSLFAVQAGTFRDPANAGRTFALMQQRYGVARIVPLHREVDLYLVVVGEAASEADAEMLAKTVRKIGKAYESAFVVRLDSRPASTQAGEVETLARLHP